MDPTFSMIPNILREEWIVVGLISRVTEVDSVFAPRSWRLEKFVVKVKLLECSRYDILRNAKYSTSPVQI